MRKIEVIGALAFCGLMAVFSYENLALNKTSESESVVVIEKDAPTSNDIGSDIESKQKAPLITFGKQLDNQDLADQNEYSIGLITNPDLITGDQLERLHTTEFSDYLAEEQANENNIIAFYSNSRWADFYEKAGYQPEEINQLLDFRDQYLADISQSGKERYYTRWANAPHDILSKTIANKMRSYLDYSEEYALVLNNVLSDVASEYGIETSFVEGVARTYLLNAINYIELTSELMSINPQYDVVEFEQDFVDFLENDAGYLKQTITPSEALTEKPISPL